MFISRNLLIAFGISALFFSIATNAKILRVGVVGAPPYVLHDQNQLSGISVDIWQQIAQNIGVDSRLSYHQIDDAVKMLRSKQLDLLIGPIAITSVQAKTLAFTQPYHRAALGIAVSEHEVTTWGRVRPQTITVISMIGITLLLLLVVAIVIWRLERGKNPGHFPKPKSKGIGNGLWFAVVTMTGVGYGDRAPVTFAGRVVTALWMIVAIIMFSSVTAGITTFFTVASIPHISIANSDFFRDAKVAVPDQITAQLVFDQYRARPLLSATPDDAFEKLDRGEVKAVIADRMELSYYIKNHPSSRAVVSHSNFFMTNYGFAFASLDAEYFNRVNVELIRLVETGQVDDIAFKWTGQK